MSGCSPRRAPCVGSGRDLPVDGQTHLPSAAGIFLVELYPGALADPRSHPGSGERVCRVGSRMRTRVPGGAPRRTVRAAQGWHRGTGTVPGRGCRGSGALPGLAPLPAQPQPFPAAMAGPRRLQATARPQGGRHGRAGLGRPCPSCRPAASHSRSIATFPFPPPHSHRHRDFVLLRRLAARSKGRQGRNGGGAGNGSPQPPRANKTPQKVPAAGCQERGQGWLGLVTSLGGVVNIPGG